ncbi:MAG: glycine cleavage system aminomethyltransferase GcvT [Thermoproteota archaeon]
MGVLRRIPLYDLHKELGASFGEFAGWEAPINYGSVIDEHVAVRRTVGFFDLSHMGRITVEGGDAAKLLDLLVPRDITSEPGQMVGPTAFLNERAGFRDDVMLYNMGSTWLVVPNAANIEKVYNWLLENAEKMGLSVKVEDRTEDLALFAIQGPRSRELMAALGAPREILELKALRFATNVRLGSATAFLISRSGWTGEDGFEVIADLPNAEKILRVAHEKLHELEGRLCGLAARDSLRMEVGFVLYGHEIDEDINPVEARYWWVFQPGPKQNCIGCPALREHLKRGVSRVRVGLRLGKKDRVIPRPGDRVLVEDVEVGTVTSGAYSPILRRSIAQAYIRSSHALMGMNVFIERRGKLYKAKIVDFPLVTPSSSPPT